MCFCLCHPVSLSCPKATDTRAVRMFLVEVRGQPDRGGWVNTAHRTAPVSLWHAEFLAARSVRV
jgi:hypothetical protein